MSDNIAQWRERKVSYYKKVLADMIAHREAILVLFDKLADEFRANSSCTKEAVAGCLQHLEDLRSDYHSRLRKLNSLKANIEATVAQEPVPEALDLTDPKAIKAFDFLSEAAEWSCDWHEDDIVEYEQNLREYVDPSPTDGIALFRKERTEEKFVSPIDAFREDAANADHSLDKRSLQEQIDVELVFTSIENSFYEWDIYAWPQIHKEHWN